MTSRTPIKRNKALQPLSREHHQGLLLSWKIKKGISKSVAPERIADYIKWFHEHYLKPHFEAEERHLFPILGNEHPLVARALKEHAELTALVEVNLHNNLNEFASLLEKHIRFEERVLFNELQETATADQLIHLEEQLTDTSFCGIWEDEFWKD